ncbi:MAG: surface lipoprotein assembly modifier [Burkholderiales bacterium]
MLRVIFAFAVAFGSACAVAQPTPDLGQADALIRAGKAVEALKLLEPHEDARAGNLDFDYLLGVAALEAGRPDKATIALERALIVNPNHAGARLDLGRAYFAMGDTVRARNEFSIVLSQNPPANARATVEAYIARIDQGGGTGQTRVTGYLELGAGRDSNVNNATSQGQIYVPVFGFSLQLAPTSQRQSDNFMNVGGGGEVTHALNNNTALYAGADARFRANQHADTFNYSQVDVRGGVQHAFDAQNLVRVGAAYQQYYLDGAFYRQTSGVNAEWRHLLNSARQLSVFGIVNFLRYKDDAQVANDTNLTMGGASLTQVLDEARRLTVSLSGFGGYERDVGQRIDGDRKLIGVRLAGQVGWGADVDVFASTGYQDSRFQSRNLIFSQERADKQFDATLGLAWRIDRAWLLRPQLTFTRNVSNIDINTYSRYEASITARRDFK